MGLGEGNQILIAIELVRVREFDAAARQEARQLLSHLAAGVDQYPLARQIRRLPFAAIGSRVIGGEHDAERLVEDGPPVQTLPRLAKRPGDSELDLAVLQQFGDVGGISPPYFQLQSRVGSETSRRGPSSIGMSMVFDTATASGATAFVLIDRARLLADNALS